MLQDLAALTPPLVVCAAFLAGVVFFLRRQMGAGRRAGDTGDGPGIGDEDRNADAGDQAPAASPERRQV